MKTYKVWLTIECENDDPADDEEEYENINEVSVKTFDSEDAATDFCCYLETMADDYKEKQS